MEKGPQINALKKPVLILGIGNYLMGDEGVGVHLARHLEKELTEQSNLDVLDGGTGGFHLMPWFEAYPNVILVDATLDDQEVGKITLIKPKFSRDFPRAMSTHDIGLKDVIEGMQLLGTMPDINLFTVSIETIQPMQVDLSPKIKKSIPELIRRIKWLSESIINPVPVA
ncbi:MAG: hydrogenase maturation protease [Saprospiraceae bacterium]|nr:hydrogenase maturation protease [Saprospiraceae bacterium]